MAVRNLARTVIEVGRTSRSKWGRKFLRRRERREAREFCRESLVGDPLDSGPTPRRYGRDYEFQQDDKLGPARRWMDSRVGQKWDDVYSELSQKFRGRGIALSHVVDTHMLGWVDYRGEANMRWWRYFDYVVDEEGILRHNTTPDRRRYDWRERRATLNDVAAWVGHRKVIVRGDRCYWTAPTSYEETVYGETRTYYVSHRQGEEFSEEDYAFWNTVGDYGRKSVLYNKEKK